MKEVVTNIKTAIAKGDETLKGDNGKQILETVNKNVDANEHISDETKESTKETTESAHSETESKPTETVKPGNTGDTGKNDNSGNNGNSGSTGNTGKPNNEKPAQKEPFHFFAYTYNTRQPMLSGSFHESQFFSCLSMGTSRIKKYWLKP
ncbi:TPA: hypothetical protein ACKOR7_001011 [Clostridioides difficile]